MRLKYWKVHTPHTHIQKHVDVCRASKTWRVWMVLWAAESWDREDQPPEQKAGARALRARSVWRCSFGPAEELSSAAHWDSLVQMAAVWFSWNGKQLWPALSPLRLTRTQQGREGICMRGIIWPTNSGPARIPDLTSPFSPGQKYSFKKQTKPEWWL